EVVAPKPQVAAAEPPMATALSVALVIVIMPVPALKAAVIPGSPAAFWMAVASAAPSLYVAAATLLPLIVSPPEASAVPAPALSATGGAMLVLAPVAGTAALPPVLNSVPVSTVPVATATWPIVVAR